MSITNPQTIIFDAPTQFKEDDSAIPSGTISKYQYGFGTTSKQYTIVKDDTDFTADASGKQTGPVPALAFGTWFAASRAVSKDGPVSDWSNEATFEVQAKTPKAPTGFSIG